MEYLLRKYMFNSMCYLLKKYSTTLCLLNVSETFYTWVTLRRTDFIHPLNITKHQLINRHWAKKVTLPVSVNVFPLCVSVWGCVSACVLCYGGMMKVFFVTSRGPLINKTHTSQDQTAHPWEYFSQIVNNNPTGNEHWEK